MRQPQWIDQAILLTRTVMERWYDLDADFILPLLAPSASWIGAAQGQYYLGQDEVAEALRQVVAALRPCKLTNQHYDAAPLAADSCVVTGHIVVTLEEQDKLLTEPQRVTMVWYRQGDQLLLAHIHVSNNAAVVAPDEQFPIRASRSAYRYLQDRLAKRRKCVPSARRTGRGIMSKFPMYPTWRPTTSTRWSVLKAARSVCIASWACCSLPCSRTFCAFIAVTMSTSGLCGCFARTRWS